MLTEKLFRLYRDLIYQLAGISVSDSKKEMFNTKIQKLMRRHGIESYDEYYKIVSNTTNTKDIQEFINTMTTNTTEFFREIGHFDFLKDNVENILTSIPRITRNREIRVWCAASSSGQEPVTLAMVLREYLGDSINIKILATDISSKVLNKAMNGVYSISECEGMQKRYLLKYFTKEENGYKVNENILKSISYRYFNLMQAFNFKRNFDIIFCRNVMIYFNNEVQQTLVNKFYHHLIPEGLLFIGHSESLLNRQHAYKYVGPSIYRK